MTDREPTYVTLEVNNVYIEDIGPLFFREKIMLFNAESKTRDELAEYVQRYAADLSTRMANFVRNVSPEFLRDHLESLKDPYGR